MTGLRPSSTLEFAGTTVTRVRAQCCRNPTTNGSPFPPSLENLWSGDGYFHIHQVKNCAFACRRHCATIWQAKTATSQAKKNLLTCSKHAARRIAKVGFVSVKSLSKKNCGHAFRCIYSRKNDIRVSSRYLHGGSAQSPTAKRPRC